MKPSDGALLTQLISVILAIMPTKIVNFLFANLRGKFCDVYDVLQMQDFGKGGGGGASQSRL